MKKNLAVLSLAIGVAVSHAARAHDPGHEQHAAPAAAPSAAKVILRDAPLLDAAGKRVQLAKDVIGARIGSPSGITPPTVVPTPTTNTGMRRSWASSSDLATCPLQACPSEISKNARGLRLGAARGILRGWTPTSAASC